MINIQNENIKKRGKCAYSTSLEYEVIIVKRNTLYGTGDYEDPAETRNDRDVECYYVYFENIVKKGEFGTGGGGFLSIEEAVLSVESKVKVKWITDSPEENTL